MVLQIAMLDPGTRSDEASSPEFLVEPRPIHFMPINIFFKEFPAP
jgi:hypothetical protein